MREIAWERIAAMLAVVLIGICGAALFLRAVFPLLLPFLISWGLSRVIHPLSVRAARGLRLSQKLCAVVLFVTVLLVGAFGIWRALLLLLEEAGGLIRRLLADGVLSDVLDGVGEQLSHWLSRMGIDAESAWRASFSERLWQVLNHALGTLGATLPRLAGALFSSLPTVFFMIVVTVASGFYFCMDGESIAKAFCGILPRAVSDWGRRVTEMLSRVFRQYLRVYLWLWLLTFLLLFLGLVFLGVEYAFLLALLISLADLLPVIGVGTVLIPWSILLLLEREYALGVGILILYLLLALIRQILEPRLVGKSLGLHPLLTLFATYLGFCLFGLLGMLLSPVAVLLIKNLLQRKKEEAQRSPGK